jgi:hypothetical protein
MNKTSAIAGPCQTALPSRLLFELWRRIDMRLRRGDLLVTPDNFLEAMQQDFTKIIGVPPSPAASRAILRAIESVNRRYPGTYLNQGIKNAVTRYLRDIESRPPDGQQAANSDVRQRIKEMVKNGQTAFFLESLGLDISGHVLPPTIEQAILKVLDGEKLRAPNQQRPSSNKPRRRHISPLMALNAHKATAPSDSGDEKPAQEPLPDADAQAEREKQETKRNREIVDRAMENAGEHLEEYQKRGLFNDQEVVELRQVLEVDGQLRRGEIDAEEADRRREGFDHVLRQTLRQRLTQTISESALLINALEAIKRLPAEHDGALAFMARHQAAIVAATDDPIMLKAIEALENDEALLVSVGRIIDRKDQEVRMMIAKLPPYRQFVEIIDADADDGGKPKIPPVSEDFIAQLRQLDRDGLTTRLNGADDQRLPLLQGGRGLLALVEYLVDESPFHLEVRHLKIRQTLTRLYQSVDGGKEGHHKVQHFLKRRLRKLYPSITPQECGKIEAESTAIMESIDKGEKPSAGKEAQADRRVYRS